MNIIPTRAKISALPYTYAKSGREARDEIIKILSRMGCTSVGFMDDFTKHIVTLQFEHRGRTVSLRVDAKGWTAMFLKAFPYSSRKKYKPAEYQARALAQGQIAVNSILRDWVKGQVTAIECGIVSFDDVFLPYTLLPSGETVAERVKARNLLGAPNAEA